MSDWHMRCSYCQASRPDLRRCTGCFTVYYCTKDCQRLDWPDHKSNCISCRNPNVDKLAETKLKDKNVTVKTENGIDEENRSIYEHRESNDRPEGAHGHAKIKELIDNDVKRACQLCNKTGCKAKCSRCKNIYYCSRECQSKDWTRHRAACSENTKASETRALPEFTEDETRIINYRQTEHNKRKRGGENLGLFEDGGTVWFSTCSDFRFYQVLSPEKLAVFERRPPRSLEKAIRFIKGRLPTWNIIRCFDEVWSEFNPVAELFRHAISNVLVAFMFMYHHHVMRHGVYLKDARDKIMHAEFYFDHLDDDPRPYFTYDQVRPGDYIFIKKPIQHIFGDGIIGFRINHPSEVLFASTNSL